MKANSTIQILFPEQHTRAWSGGSTTELAIYPADAEYSQQQFDWRLSTATITTSESVFTSLPGYTRHLLVLEGSLALTHVDHHVVHLLVGDQDTFGGEWVTRCVSTSQSVDFNLMLTDSYTGSLAYLSLSPGESHTLSQKEHTQGFPLLSPSPTQRIATVTTVWHALYCVAGSVQILVEQNHAIDQITLHPGEFVLLCVTGNHRESIQLANTEKDQLLLVHAAISDRSASRVV